MNILYEDNHLLVAEKPAGVPAQADASGAADMLTLLKAYLKEKYQKSGAVYLGLVHRLDRPASGLMVFARTSKAAGRLSEQIRRGEMQKGYFAVVQGAPPREGRLEDYLLKDPRKNQSRIARPEERGAKKAALEYQVLQQEKRQALVRIRLLTGRPHQIRLQFASRGWPLAGDAKYGSGGQDLALYSYFLGFAHPTKQQAMRFYSLPCAPAFAPFAQAMRQAINAQKKAAAELGEAILPEDE